MNSICEAKIRDYLVYDLRYRPVECGAILGQITDQARMAGFDVDERFALAGLGAGPEARIASRIVGRALGEHGDEIPEYAIRKEIEGWLHKTPQRSLWSA
jgi:hypothetical protein